MAQCLNPITLKEDKQIVPCGSCPNCRKNRVASWSFRLMQQDKVSNLSLFVTLTYDTKYVPITRNGFMSLRFSDVQKFFKRLRKQTGKPDIKYYYAGEYGGRTNRPHYHIILFNVKHEEVIKAWALQGKPIGHIHFGNISEASVGYTLKYINKPKIARIPLHRNDDREPERACMSKGLGLSYLTDAMILWHKSDLENRMYCNLLDGKKIGMPRYYKEKLYTPQEREQIKQVVTVRMLDKMLESYLKSDTRTEANRRAAVKHQYELAYKKSLKADKL